MKKIKLFFVGLLTTLSAFLCLCFTGCDTKEGTFNANSVKYDFFVYDDSVSVEYSFEFTMPSNTTYNVNYEVAIYCKGAITTRKTQTKTFTPSESKTRTQSGYLYDLPYTQNSVEKDYRLVIQNVSIKPAVLSGYTAYAIGFGVTGGAILIGSIALFIVLKKKEK